MLKTSWRSKSNWDRKSLACSLSVAGDLATFLLVEAGNKVTDTKVLDKFLKYLILVNLDVLDLNLGVVGDEVHLAFSFLL